MASAPKTFVSYSSEDRVFVLGLVAELTAAGADLWVDILNIPTGAHWDNEIGAALKACPQMLLVLSPASVKSDNVGDEIAYALKRKRLIVPVLYKECDEDIPYRIQRIQYIDLRWKSEYSVQQLLRALNVAPKPKPLISVLALPKVQAAPAAAPAGEKAGSALWRDLALGKEPSSIFPPSRFPAAPPSVPAVEVFSLPKPRPSVDLTGATPLRSRFANLLRTKDVEAAPGLLGSTDLRHFLEERSKASPSSPEQASSNLLVGSGQPASGLSTPKQREAMAAFAKELLEKKGSPGSVATDQTSASHPAPWSLPTVMPWDVEPPKGSKRKR